MDYICMLNAFEQNYYNRIKEIERVAAAAAAAAAHGNLRNNSSSSSSSLSSSASTASSSTASSPLSASSSSPTGVTSFATSSTTSSSVPNSNQYNQQQHFAAFAHSSKAAAAAAAAVAAQQHLQQLQQQHHQHNQLFQQNQHHQQSAANQNNSNVANSLLWQPWRDLQQAAAVHHRLYQQQQQQLQKEARLTSKELPTSKWRRERRLRTAEYHVAALGAASSSTTSPPNSPPPTISAHTNISHANPGVSSVLPPSHTQMSIMMAAAAPSIRPLSESTNRPTPPPTSPTPTLHMNHLQHSMESPIDMSVTSTTMKRASPPPPYREPLPGSTYATSLARPSVITQAPPKRGGELCDNILISNRENDNRSTESISMCETVIDEHFRRSLGPDYVALFAKKASAPNSTTPSPQPTYLSNTTNSTPTPPPPPTNAPLPISYQPQPLISPKPTAILLAASAIVNQTRSEPITARTEKTQQHVTTTSNVSGHVSIQQQPLPLQHSNTPQPNAPNSPQPINATRKVASPLNLHGSNELHSTTHSPAASPRHSPTVNVSTGKSNLNSVVVSSSTTPATVPAVMRIKTEPGFSTAGTTTPPASPTSSSSNNSFTTNSDILASVDDHFAKALGDTWKKLQENKEMRK